MATELADAIGVSPATISRWVKTGLLVPAIRVGRSAGFDARNLAQAQALRDSDYGGRLTCYLPAADGFEYLGYEAAGELLDVSAFTVRRWVKAGKLQGYRRGRHDVFVRRDDVETLAAARERGQDGGAVVGDEDATGRWGGVSQVALG